MKNKYNIISSDSKKSKELIIEFNKLIDNNKWELNKTNFDYLFIFGGDGTFLRSVSNYINKKVKIIVINGGTFGFYSFFSKNNLEDLFKDIENDKNYMSPLMLEIDDQKQKIKCMNEIVFVSNHLIKLDINIDDIKYERFKGTGLLFSTPIGTTGRNRSAKGSVIFPDNNVYQMVEIEAIQQKKYNSLNSPIILNAKNEFDINVLSFINNYYLMIDGTRYEYNQKQNFKIKSFKPKFSLYYPPGLNTYIKKLRNKFITTE